MMIECPECQKQVSDSAHSCVNCGYPIKGKIEVGAGGEKITTVQNTGKSLKVHMLVSGAIALIGGLMMLGGAPVGGVVLIAISIAYTAITRVRIWWNHS
ncbi:MAG: zinc ribbon domain-containing protein [Sulfurimonas sp.]|nr:zinc ribbon domain-containing protein [Sulfurimonas sp.]